MQNKFNFKEILHFEDNEVYREDENGKVIESTKYDSTEEAKEAFNALMREIEKDENYRAEFLHYLPKFMPQRVKILVKGEAEK